MKLFGVIKTIAVIGASCRLSYYCLMLKLKPYAWLQANLQNNSESYEVREEGILDEQKQYFKEQHEVVRLASRLLPFKAECLPRSLVLRDLLRARAVEAQVMIGVGKEAGTKALLSHAWVEVQGEPIGEREDLKENFKAVQGADPFRR